ncbi:MAG TPA: LamG-like jellyroll fold domain-containing protein [Streptomyces sp.]|nr:LamG-like jellyroll fold domain-containing protein [Streptomyces sp.]
MSDHHGIHSRGRFRQVALVAAVASLPLAGLPAVAAAAEDNPPSRPLVSELSTGNRACAAGPDRPYVNTLPLLSAVLRDPDAGPVAASPLTAQFEVSWKGAGGERQTRVLDHSTSKASGSVFRLPVPSDVPAHTVIDWRVRAHDGTQWGPWSSSGGQHRCEFVYDNEAPGAPAVSSPDYPETDDWHDGVGVYGSFTFEAADDDVVSYRYSFLGEVPRTVSASEPGGPVTVRWMPRGNGYVPLTVQTQDRAGNVSAPTTYGFRVGSGRTPAAHWKLADPAGSGQAAAEAGDRPAAAGAGVGFGTPAPSGTKLTSAAWLDGSADAYLTPGATAVDTAGPFAVSTWVRAESLDRDMTAVGQDGTSGVPFTLGLDADGEAGAAWVFELPTASGAVRVRGGSPAAGQWTHLAAVYDPVARTAVLYVNGRPSNTAEQVADAVATDALQIGRAHRSGGGGSTGHWHGALADVRLWDRVVVTEEFAALAARAARLTGHWRFNEQRDGVSPERDGGQGMILGGGASIHSEEMPLVGTGHLQLDGDGGHAATQEPPVATDDSFSLTARVRTAEGVPVRDMAVLSLPGDHTNALVVRYGADTGKWELAVSHTDRADAEVTTVRAEAGYLPPFGDHLAVVYDASSGVVRLYVDGVLQTTAEAELPGFRAWAATGGLQVGRAMTADGWGEYLHGDVDEVRAYSGTLTQDQVRMLSGDFFESPDP